MGLLDTDPQVEFNNFKSCDIFVLFCFVFFLYILRCVDENKDLDINNKTER